MAKDTSVVAEQLRLITAELRPAPNTSPHHLHQARVAVASALATNGTAVAARANLATAQAPAAVTPVFQQLLDAALQESSPQVLGGSAYVIVRRELPMAISGNSSLGADAVAGQASDVTYGPFLDLLGRPVWIDLYRIIRQVNLVRTPGGAPFLVLPIQGILGIGGSYTLGPGSVWIASQQLASAAPADGYTGLLITGGSVKFSSPLTYSGTEIVVPASVTCTLSLDLNPGTAPGGSGVGQDARLSKANLPATVGFVFAPGHAGVESAAPGSVGVYGSTVEADVVAGVATYDTSLKQVLYPAKTAALSFHVKDVRSDQFVPSGTAHVHRVAWALPVTVTPASSLGSAAGAGSFALFLDTGLLAAWKGQTNPVPAGPLVILVGPGLITVVALQVLGLGTNEGVPLWSGKPGDPPSSQLTLGWKSAFALSFFSSSAGTEILAMLGSIDGSFDRPITVTGCRVYVHSDLALILFVESAAFTGLIIEAVLQPPPINPLAALAFAIANAVFRTTQAQSLILVAAFNGTQSPSGGVAIGFGLQYLLPILPDPYAANFDVAVRQLRDANSGSVGVLTAIVLWTPALPPVLTYLLPANAATALLGASASTYSGTLAVAPSFAARGAAILLDLSTNVDQFGIAWSTNSAVRGEASVHPLVVESMYLETSSNAVYVLTVPSVLWEPVYTDPPPSPPYPTGYPSPISFASSGGPTAIGVQSVNLVRVAPAPALDSLVGNFNTSLAPASAIARLTLPFGMEAVANLTKPANAASPGANVAYNRPTFTAESVIGGYQISLTAVDPMYPDSPGFQGYTTQLRNALYNGVPTVPPTSILGVDVDTIFNAYLGLGGARPLVPVTRLDLSGYGESLFSDWRDETGNPVAVSKARFDVVIGRTSVEIVQVRSILYPYAVRVVRTITIERKNTGVVARQDSGWQAASNGEYNFPAGTLTVHPGIVQKIVNVVNIRDTGQRMDVGGGVQVAGVYFDGDLVIEGVTKGAGPDGVPARNQIGYVQLTPESPGGPLTDLQYQQLIANAGPLGGGIDCILNVASSGLPMKLGRVGVGVTQGMGGPEFVMTAWGSPQFPLGGQWSFLKQTGSGTAPELIDTDLGVPLIRAGAVPNPPPLNSPYRFADPVDLAVPASPASDYGIVHATGTQRVFFQRPKIEANSPHQITSTVAPTLADPYSLANSVGLFPRTDSAIPFPNANYSLTVSAGGAIKLQLPSPTFPVTVGQRTISQAGGVRAYADYTGSQVTIAIDTAAAIPWTFQLQGVTAVTSSTLMGDVLSLKTTVAASANTETQLINPKMTFGGALGPVQDILAFLTTLGLPTPLSVAMTNQVKIKAGLKIPDIDDLINAFLPPGGPQVDDADITVSLVIANPIAEADFEFEATFMIPTPFDPLMAVGLIKMQLQMSTASGNTFTLTVGAGLGVSFKIGAFGVDAYFAETMFLIAGDTVLGFGVGLLIKGTVDLEIVSVEVSVEAKMAILKVTSPGTMTIYGVAQVTFAIDITICLVLDIDIEVQAEEDQNLNGGTSPLPDVL